MIDRPSGLGAKPSPEVEEQSDSLGGGLAFAYGAPARARLGRDRSHDLRFAAQADLRTRRRRPSRSRARPRVPRPSFRTRAAFTPACIATGCGRCASSPDSATPSRRTNAITSCSRKGRRACPVAFDMPTLMGYDSDAPQSRGEVGRCGVAIDSMRDMEVLFDGIDLGEITTSMTINGPAAIALAQYIATAEKKGIPRRSSAARCKPTSSKNTSRRRNGSFRRVRTCASSST